MIDLITCTPVCCMIIIFNFFTYPGNTATAKLNQPDTS